MTTVNPSYALTDVTSHPPPRQYYATTQLLINVGLRLRRDDPRMDRTTSSSSSHGTGGNEALQGWTGSATWLRSARRARRYQLRSSRHVYTTAARHAAVQRHQRRSHTAYYRRHCSRHRMTVQRRRHVASSLHPSRPDRSSNNNSRSLSYNSTSIHVYLPRLPF